MTCNITTLLVLSAATACVAWTITQEAIFTWLKDVARSLVLRGGMISLLCATFLTGIANCRYCCSHWCALFWLLLCDKPLEPVTIPNFFLSWFMIVGVANLMMEFYNLLLITARRLA